MRHAGPETPSSRGAAAAATRLTAEGRETITSTNSCNSRATSRCGQRGRCSRGGLALLVLLLPVLAGSPRGCCSMRTAAISRGAAEVGVGPRLLRDLQELHAGDAGGGTSDNQVGGAAITSSGSDLISAGAGSAATAAAATLLATAATAANPADAWEQPLPGQPPAPPPPLAPPPENVATARDCAEFFALLRNPAIRVIVLPQDLCMQPATAPSQPVMLGHNVSVVGAALAAAEGLLAPFSPVGINLGLGIQGGGSSSGGGSGAGSTAGGGSSSNSSNSGGDPRQPPPPAFILLNLTRLDFAFLPARIQLQRGVVLMLRGLELWRAQSRVSAHLDFLAASPAPGAGRVVIESCIQHRVACLSLPKAEENYRSLPRGDELPAAAGGSSSNSSSNGRSIGTGGGSGSSYGIPVDEDGQSVEMRTSPPVCWFNMGCSDAVPADGNSNSVAQGQPPPPPPPSQQQVATSVAPPPEIAAAADAAGVAGRVQCRSPYLRLRDVSYTTQILDSTFLNNGGYTVT